MAKEIERKFLVIGNGWRENAAGTHYRQGYLNSVKERTVRIRTINDKAFLTVKGLTVGCTRLEFADSIPYHGSNEGLIVAEIEIPSEDTSFEKPDWLGEEVSSDPRYFNSNLVSHPYTTWNK